MACAPSLRSISDSHKRPNSPGCSPDAGWADPRRTARGRAANSQSHAQRLPVRTRLRSGALEGSRLTGSAAASRRGPEPECGQAGAGAAPRGACPSAHEVVQRAGDGRVLPLRCPQLPYHYDFERVVEIVYTNVAGGANVTHGTGQLKSPLRCAPCCQGRRGLRGTTLIDGRLNAEWT